MRLIWILAALCLVAVVAAFSDRSYQRDEWDRVHIQLHRDTTRL